MINQNKCNLKIKSIFDKRIKKIFNNQVLAEKIKIDKVLDKKNQTEKLSAEKSKIVKKLEEKIKFIKKNLKIITTNLNKLEVLSTFDLKNNKFLFTNKTIDILYSIFKNKGLINNEFKKIVDYMIEKKVIHKSSSLYHGLSKDYEFNPLSKQFLDYKPYLSNNYLDLKNSIENKIEDAFLEESIDLLDVYIFYYINLFEIKNYSFDEITNIVTNYSIKTSNNNVYFMSENRQILKNKTETYSKNYRILTFSSKIKEYLDRYMFVLHKNNVFKSNALNLFTKKNYLKDLKIFLKEFNITLNEVKNINYFYLTYKSSPLDVYLKSCNNYPTLKIEELKYFFPTDIDDNLQKNYSYNNHIDSFIKLDIDDYEDPLLDDISSDKMELYDKLTNLYRNFNSKKQFISNYNFYKEIYSLNKNKLTQLEKKALTIVNNHCIKFINGNKNGTGHLKKVLRIIIKQAIYSIFKNGYINESIFDLYYGKTLLKKNKPSQNTTKIEYQNILKIFLKELLNVNLRTLKFEINHRRSIIFKEELSELVKSDLDLYDKTKNKSSITKYQLLLKPIMFIILFSTGLRRKELITRNFKDIYIDNECMIIDVNIQGCKYYSEITKTHVQLKNSSATRRIKFSLTNNPYSKYIREFIDAFNHLRKKNKITKNLLFQECLDKNDFFPIKDAYLHKLNTELQKKIDRNVTLHSFRHSKVTYETKKILTNPNMTKFDFLNLSIEIGHSSPSVTIRNYLHIDLLDLI